MDSEAYLNFFVNNDSGYLTKFSYFSLVTFELLDFIIFQLES